MTPRVERIGNCELWLGDCREVLGDLPQVDCVVTDPPYGIAHVWKGGFSPKHGWGQVASERNERNAWDNEPADVSPLLNVGRHQIIWGGNFFALPPSRGWLVWKKPGSGFSLSDAELAWTNLDQPVRCIDCQRLTALNGELGAGGPVKPDHPTQKPVAVMEWCLSFVAGIVLDPFAGSFTTGVACAKLGRRFIGIEIDPRYYEIGLRRIEAAYRQADLFVAAPVPIDPAEQRCIEFFAEPTP